MQRRLQIPFDEATLLALMERSKQTRLSLPEIVQAAVQAFLAHKENSYAKKILRMSFP